MAASEPDRSPDGINMVRRTSSEKALNDDDILTMKYDPYRALERSQSDAALLQLNPLDFGTNSYSSDFNDNTSIGTGHRVSECSRVYLDLSTADGAEGDGFYVGDKKQILGRTLETIHQKEELKLNITRNRDRLSESPSPPIQTDKVKKEKHYATSLKFMKVTQEPSGNKTKSTLKTTLQTYSQNLMRKISLLLTGVVPQQVGALKDILVLVDQAWGVPVFGRELAYNLCDQIRFNGILEVLISNCNTEHRALLVSSVKVLEQVMTTDNRQRVAEIGLEVIVNLAAESKQDEELILPVTGVLESLLKNSEDTCSRMIKLGGLDTILFYCRSKDVLTLRRCAAAIVNLALYGGVENQKLMIKHRVPEWLFPLAFSKDDSLRYYACLAISVLMANPEVEAAVRKSGTMELVAPFIASHSPSEFAHSDKAHQQGRAQGWLKRLVPLLSSKQHEVQGLGAFHFAMEAGIKSEQGNMEVFHEIDCIDPLKKLASCGSFSAAKLAVEALKLMNEEVPHQLCRYVPLWSVKEVSYWVKQIGFCPFAEKFMEFRVDGDMLLTMSESDLIDSIDLKPSLLRKRFLRDLRQLKMSTNYSECDPSRVSHWLMMISPEFNQYTYNIIQNGIDLKFLQSLTEDELKNDCGIHNGVHRRKIFQKTQEQKRISSSVSMLDSPDNMSPARSLDVFISYRRSNGSQLASLLKVHLQLRGFSVFLDIERLWAGKFDESLLNSIKIAHHFILVLTPRSLDRCIGDTDHKDWVHKEIATAISSGCNIIPLVDNDFEWPQSEKLPEDMKTISFYNAIRWVHDYQDACVDKLERFLRGEPNVPQKADPLQICGSTFSISELENMHSVYGNKYAKPVAAPVSS